MARAICTECKRVYRWHATRGSKLADCPCPYCGNPGRAYKEGPEKFGAALRSQEKEKFFKWCGVTTKVNGKDTIIQFPIDLNHLDKHALPKLKKEWDLIEFIWDVGAWDIHLEKYTSPSKHFYLGKEVGETFEDLAKAIYKTIEKLYL